MQLPALKSSVETVCTLLRLSTLHCEIVLIAIALSILQSWIDTVAIRRAVYYAITYHFASIEHGEQRKFGVQLAYLGRAYSYLTAITPKQLKNVAPDVAALFDTKMRVCDRASRQCDSLRVLPLECCMPDRVAVHCVGHCNDIRKGAER
jgi:hypothetical protein